MHLLRQLFLVALLTLGGCGERAAPEPASGAEQHSRLLVVASNYPLYYFTHRIAGESADVVLPRIEGDPAEWKPGREAIAKLQEADLIILNGAGYESWLGWITLPPQRLLDTSAGFAERLLPLREETVHQHGPGGAHSHEGTAFTVWLDPELAAKQAEAIEQALSDRLPGHGGRHRENLAKLKSELQQLDHALQQGFERFGEQPVLFSHPVYQYLEARYRLDGASVHWEPGETPGTRALLEFRERLSVHPARFMLWEDEPREAAAAALRQLGVDSIVFHTVANRPGDGDYFDAMRANLARLLLQCCGTTINSN
jgi:zinc transport system substrate-binding protein